MKFCYKQVGEFECPMQIFFFPQQQEPAQVQQGKVVNDLLQVHIIRRS